jgi:glycine oxidase
MASQADVVIVGGGIIGLTTAYFLAREGLRVQVVDQGDLGRQASWAGAGILPPGNLTAARTPYELLRAHSTNLLVMLGAELRERTGVDNGYLRTGGLEFFEAGDEAAAHEWRAAGAVCDVVEGEALRRLEPALAPGLGKAHFLPEVAQIRNPRHLQALIAGCQGLGVLLRPNCPVLGFERAGRQITALKTILGPVPAGRILVAAGTWTDALLGPLGWQPGIRPIRGQIALLNPGQPVLKRVLMWGARYLVPRADGRVLVGSTQEDVGFDTRTTAVAIADLLKLACDLVPCLAASPLERCWAGLRPGSTDGLPFIGPVPGFDNLFVAAGHFRTGIQLSAGTALGLKELLLGQPLTVPLDAFRPDRAIASSSAYRD